MAGSQCTQFRGAWTPGGAPRGYVNCGGRRFFTERLRDGRWRLTETSAAAVLDVKATERDVVALLATRTGLVLERRDAAGRTQTADVKAGETHARSGSLDLDGSGWRAAWTSDDNGGSSLWEATSAGGETTTRQVTPSDSNLSDVHLVRAGSAGQWSLLYARAGGPRWDVELTTATGAAPFDPPRAIRSTSSEAHPWMDSSGSRLVSAYLQDNVPTLCLDLSPSGDCRVPQEGQRSVAGATNVTVAGTGDGAVMAWTDNIGFAGDGSDVYAAGRVSGRPFRFKITRTHAYSYQQVLQVLAEPRGGALIVYLGTSGIEARALQRVST